MLGIREAGGVAGGLEHELVLESLELLTTSVELIGVGNHFCSIVGVGGGSCGCGGGGGGSGSGSEAIHGLLGVCQPLLEATLASHVFVAL